MDHGIGKSGNVPFTDIWPKYKGTDRAMALATEYVRSRIPIALRDPGRPRCHFAPPAQAMLDVWGGMCFNGTHRLFSRPPAPQPQRFAENKFHAWCFPITVNRLIIKANLESITVLGNILERTH